jgi:hypothetical protein
MQPAGQSTGFHLPEGIHHLVLWEQNLSSNHKYTVSLTSAPEAPPAQPKTADIVPIPKETRSHHALRRFLICSLAIQLTKVALNHPWP